VVVGYVVALHTPLQAASSQSYLCAGWLRLRWCGVMKQLEATVTHQAPCTLTTHAPMLCHLVRRAPVPVAEYGGLPMPSTQAWSCAPVMVVWVY
jgi:hypothetical protein